MDIDIAPLSQLQDRAIEWLWPRRLALGKLAIFDGDPDQGKSLVTLDLAARLSTGRPFADGQPSPGPANVLIFCAEDNDKDTIKPRLRTLGGDLERIFVWPSESPLVRFPSQIDVLDKLLARTQAKLVIIDPIMAFLDGSVNTSNDPSVRAMLDELARLARKYGCCILLVRHLNKKSGAAIYRGAGSIAFAAVCRFGWLVGFDPEYPEDQRRHVLAQVGNNLAEPQPSLGYRLVKQADGWPAVEWLGESRWTRDDLVARRSPRAMRRAAARSYLLELLKDGPRQSEEVWQGAGKRGLSRRTVNRATKDLKIRCERGMKDGKAYCFWTLPGQEIPAEFRPVSATPKFDAFLDQLEKQFPRQPEDEQDDAA